MGSPSDHSGFDFRVTGVGTLCAQEQAHVLTLFERSYRQANPSFLQKSMERLGYVAMAVRHGALVGFALGETRLMELPRLPAQTVSLAGIACVAPEFRRCGLFSKLGLLALAAGAVPEKPRRLVCGRMAHPAAMRTIGRIPTAVPKRGVRPTSWQQDVGGTIAEAYGVCGFDPTTFVCIGEGRPIGYPRIDIEVEPHEWDLFQPVDRDRGDALLTIAWTPDAPPGW